MDRRAGENKMWESVIFHSLDTPFMILVRGRAYVGSQLGDVLEWACRRVCGGISKRKTLTYATNSEHQYNSNMFVPPSAHAPALWSFRYQRSGRFSPRNCFTLLACPQRQETIYRETGAPAVPHQQNRSTSKYPTLPFSATTALSQTWSKPLILWNAQSGFGSENDMSLIGRQLCGLPAPWRSFGYARTPQPTEGSSCEPGRMMDVW